MGQKIIQILNLPDGTIKTWRVSEEQMYLIEELQRIGAFIPDVVVEELIIESMD